MKKKIIIAVAVLLIGALAFAGGLYFGGLTGKEAEESEISEPDQSNGNYLEYNGHYYKYNNRITNILILGIDKNEAFKSRYMPGEAGQSDFIAILSLDSDTKTAKIMQINRNTMTTVDHYDSSAARYDSAYEAITLQYAYSIGNDSSAYATKKTVSKLLGNLPIESYVVLNMSGVGKITEKIGGIDVILTDDYTETDESYIKGAELHLSGEAAEKFVRSRKKVFGSSDRRMYRQGDFIRGFSEKLIGIGAENLLDMVNEYLGDYIIIDIPVDDIESMSEYSFETDSIIYLPGELKEGSEYEEFIVDEEKLQSILIDLFYIQVK